MPRGDNPNSRNNLRPFEKGLPEKSQRENQRKGAKAGGKAKHEYATFAEAARDLVDSDLREKIIKVLAQRAAMGNIKALELLLAILGEKPAEKIQVAQIEPGAVAEVDNWINGIIGQSAGDD